MQKKCQTYTQTSRYVQSQSSNTYISSSISFFKNYKFLRATRLLGVQNRRENTLLVMISLWHLVHYCFFQNYNGTMVGDGCNAPHYVPDVFLMSIILFMGTFLLSIELKDFKNALFFPSKVNIK